MDGRAIGPGFERFSGLAVWGLWDLVWRSRAETFGLPG